MVPVPILTNYGSGSGFISKRKRLIKKNLEKPSSDSGIVINYGSGSASQKVTVPTVPVPQPCFSLTV